MIKFFKLDPGATMCVYHLMFLVKPLQPRQSNSSLASIVIYICYFQFYLSSPVFVKVFFLSLVIFTCISLSIRQTTRLS